MPSVSASRTSSGKLPACSASMPTCGPLPCTITRSLPAAAFASCAAAIRTLLRCASALTASPCLSNALPPNAITISIAFSSLGQRSDENSLDRVEAVFCLLENNRRVRLEYVVCHFHAIEQAIFIADLLADLRLGVVKRGQAMHELHARIAAGREQGRIHLEGQQLLDPFAPFFKRLTHRYPDVGINEIDPLHRFRRCFR